MRPTCTGVSESPKQVHRKSQDSRKLLGVARRKKLNAPRLCAGCGEVLDIFGFNRCQACADVFMAQHEDSKLDDICDELDEMEDDDELL